MEGSTSSTLKKNLLDGDDDTFRNNDASDIAKAYEEQIKKRFYIMSFDKFIRDIDTIIGQHFDIFDAGGAVDAVRNNSIVFIDEFDSTKDKLMDYLVDNAFGSKVDCITAFKLYVQD